MKNKFIWVLIKALFNSKTRFKSILRSKSIVEVEEFKNKALAEENYELAAVLEYYLNFKFKRHESV